MADTDKKMSQQIFGAVLWQSLLQFFMRGSGVISTLILTRLLIPEDFGIVAACYLLISFCQILFDSGASLYLIKEKELKPGAADTFWTMRILAMLVAYGLILGATSPASSILDEPRMLEALPVLGLVILINAFQNVGFVLVQRDFEYKAIVKAAAIAKVVSLVVTISLAFLLKSFWALIGGTLISALVQTALSYRLCAYRPRFTLVEWRAQLSFSLWTALKSFVGYIRYRGDHFLVSSSYGLTLYGYYNLGYQLVFDIGGMLLAGIGNPLQAGYARLQDNPAELSVAVTKSMLAILTILVPVTFGAFLVGDLLVLFVLGAKWLPMAPLLPILSVYLCFHYLTDTTSRGLVAIDKIGSTVWISVAVVALALFTILQIIPAIPIAEVALIRTGFAALATLAMSSYFFYSTRLPLKELISAFLLPVGAGVIAFAAGDRVNVAMVSGDDLVRLFAVGGLSLFVYIVLMTIGVKLGRGHFRCYAFLHDLVSGAMARVIKRRKGSTVKEASQA